MIVRVTTQKVRVVKTMLSGEEAYQDTPERATSFCACLKSKERGKWERRAIASANMVLRAHLSIVEKFHLILSKPLEGSVIGCGGEEKKRYSSHWTLSRVSLARSRSSFKPRKMSPNSMSALLQSALHSFMT